MYNYSQLKKLKANISNKRQTTDRLIGFPDTKYVTRLSV